MQLKIRDALVGFVEADYKLAYPTVPFVTDNSPFNWNDPPKLFTEFEIEFNWGKRISLGGALKVRVLGFVYVTARAADGAGVRESLGRLDWFSAKLGEAVVPAVGYRIVFQAPRPADCSPWKSWDGRAVKFDFHADPT